MTEAGTVLVTDVVWDDIEIESSRLAEVGHRAILAEDPSEETLARLAAEHRVVGILTCFAPVTERVIDASPDLRAISRLGVGTDNIAVAHAESRGLPVVRVAEYCTNEVAVHTVALALAAWRRLPGYRAGMVAGDWGTSAQPSPVRRAQGARAAVLGRGRIGDAVATALGALGFEVTDEVDGADLVSVHVPLTDETRHLVDAELLARLAPGAVLVNTARGGVVDLDAVLEALESGQLAGVGLDVFPDEPYDPSSPLLEHPNAVVTPHVAFYSEESLAELREKATVNLIEALR